MAGKQTFTMIKPTAFKNNNTGAILKMINEAGFEIKAMKVVQLSTKQAGAFYAVHKERPFFDSLTDFMTSGPIVVMILEGDDVIAKAKGLKPYKFLNSN